MQFACTKLTGDSLFHLFWEVVKRLERIGLKVCTFGMLSRQCTLIS